jgi:hypothetical protein
LRVERAFSAQPRKSKPSTTIQPASHPDEYVKYGESGTAYYVAATDFGDSVNASLSAAVYDFPTQTTAIAQIMVARPPYPQIDQKLPKNRFRFPEFPPRQTLQIVSGSHRAKLRPRSVWCHCTDTASLQAQATNSSRELVVFSLPPADQLQGHYPSPGYMRVVLAAREPAAAEFGGIFALSVV